LTDAVARGERMPFKIKIKIRIKIKIKITIYARGGRRPD